MKLSGPTPRSTVRRVARRAAYDPAVIHAILDEAYVATVAFSGEDGQPFAIPMAFVRVGERIYFHGAVASRLLGTLGEGAKVAVSVTLLDGLVLAKSAFHHSMNYRSVVILGRAEPVADAEEKRRVLDALVDRLSPGRSGLVRPPSTKELAATAVAALALDEASAKIREGGPLDDEADLAWPCWAGHVPLRLVRQAEVPAQPDPAAHTA
jgi:nitroimidazol reductase NimA-like FMN-containing flavoprotein (pyridoxamine 5'-phosphate oxidase superfamily)